MQIFKEISWYKDPYFYFSIIFVLLVFLQQSIFSIYAFLLIYFLNILKFKKYKILLLTSTISFFALRFIFALSDRFNYLWKHFSLTNYASDERFWDLQLNLISMKCIIGSVDNYYLKFSSTSYKSCPYSAKYGPLSTKVPYFGDIWIGTLLLSFLVIICITGVYIYFIRKTGKNFFFITTLLLIAPMNFLIERMNIDIFILLFLLLAVSYYDKFPKLSIVLITILSLYKLHPFGVLIGLLFYSFIYDSKKNFNNLINATFSFAVLYLLDSIFFTNSLIDTEWRPAGLDITFGILSDSLILSQIINTSFLLNYFLILGLIVIFTIFFDFTSIMNFHNYEKKDNLLYFSFIFLFFLNSLYANYDYRIPLFFPLIYLIFKNGHKRAYFLTFFIFVMPIDLSIQNLILGNLTISNMISLLGRLSYYSFLIINLQNIKNIIFDQLLILELSFLNKYNVIKNNSKKK